MSDFKEFQAKTLDQAIQDACAFYNTERVKLEIDILEDAKSGIFGLVGARKARINARIAEIPTSFATAKEEKKSGRPAKVNKPKSPKSASKTDVASLEDKLDSLSDSHAREQESPAYESDCLQANEVLYYEDEKQDAQETRTQQSSVRTSKQTSKMSTLHGYAPHAQAPQEDEEEDQSQRAFLAKMKPHGEEHEELDDHVLEALDREAMAKANLLGNMTAAEVRAHEQNASSDENYKPRQRTNGRTNQRQHQSRERRDENPRSRNGRDSKLKNPRDGRDQKVSQERAFYEQKRRQERAERPPKQFVKPDYEPVPLPRVPLEELDAQLLITTAREVIEHLVSGIVGEDATIEIKVSDDRVRVSIESEDTGLLIGREGQHLAAIQYLLARIMTRKMGSQIRVQVDTGDYHSRQDSRMEFLAQTLAEKAKTIGRPQSTRPLSAYQRRVIHLALQDDEEIQTRSCGEGSLKRVIVMKRRPNVGDKNEQMDNLELDQDMHEIDSIDDSAFFDELEDKDIETKE